MRLSLVLGSALAAVPVAMAQTDLLTQFTKIPCTLSCASALTNTKCSLTDTACICADQVLQDAVTACVIKSCPVKDALSVKNITVTACHVPVRNREPEYSLVNTVLGIISACFIVQRFAYKLFAKVDFTWDDWFALLTIVSGVPSTVMNAYGLAPNGMGRDVWTLSPDQITKFGYYFYFVEVLYFFQVSCLKLSLLCFYLRIFPDKKVQRLLWGTIVFDVLFGISYIFVGIFQCAPVSHFWTKWDGEHPGSCLDINSIGWSNAGISIVLDAWMLAIPLWQLKDLRMSLKKKLGVAAMLCVGTFVTVVSILRLQSLVQFRSDTINPTWDYVNVAIWSDVEVNVGIICICMPSLRLLLTRLFPKVFGGSSNASYVNYSNSNSRSRTGGSRKHAPVTPNSASYSGNHRNYSTPIQMKTFVYENREASQSGDVDEKDLVPKRSPQEF